MLHCCSPSYALFFLNYLPLGNVLYLKLYSDWWMFIWKHCDAIRYSLTHSPKQGIIKISVQQILSLLWLLWATESLQDADKTQWRNNTTVSTVFVNTRNWPWPRNTSCIIKKFRKIQNPESVRAWHWENETLFT